MDEYEDLGLRGGLWRGQVRRAAAPGRILLVHMGEVLDRAEVTPLGEGVWQVSVRLPADRLTDGAVTFALHEDTGAGDGEALQPGSTVLATLPLIAGKALHRDLRAELALLRAELDLLKREFRRHAAEVAQRAADDDRDRRAAAQAAPDPQQSTAEPMDAAPVPASETPDTAPPEQL